MEVPDEVQEPGYLTQSLFTDKTATVSEENIQRILSSQYKLPATARVALVKLEAPSSRSYYWNDEDYQKTQQAYVDQLNEELRKNSRVQQVATIPDLLLPQPATFTGIREAAVRMQADLVLVYSISNDIYSKYKLFSKTDIKAFATTQVLLMDVRTGLVPFTTVVTREFQSKKAENELDILETRRRIQREAGLLTIREIGQRLSTFLASKP